MRISLCNEVIASLPFPQQCDFARQVGYDGLEVAPMTLSDEPHRLAPATRAALRRAAQDAGIAITSLHYLLKAPAGLSITTADKAVRTKSVDVMRALCDLAADLGASILVHGSPDQRRLTPGEETEGRKRAADCFAAVAPAAAAAGVTYCVEPLSRNQTDCINTVAEAVDIVRLIDNPALRAIIDCSSAGLSESEPVADVLRRWIPTGFVAHVHFNDPNRRGPGEGDLAFMPVLSALRDTRYGGFAAVEPFTYRPDGPTCAARAIGYLRGLLETMTP
jgi:D-psicose/D-tagatose/L-ribulose 3-epimerase